MQCNSAVPLSSCVLTLIGLTQPPCWVFANAKIQCEESISAGFETPPAVRNT